MKKQIVVFILLLITSVYGMNVLQDMPFFQEENMSSFYNEQDIIFSVNKNLKIKIYTHAKTLNYSRSWAPDIAYEKEIEVNDYSCNWIEIIQQEINDLNTDKFQKYYFMPWQYYTNADNKTFQTSLLPHFAFDAQYSSDVYTAFPEGLNYIFNYMKEQKEWELQLCTFLESQCWLQQALRLKSKERNPILISLFNLDVYIRAVINYFPKELLGGLDEYGLQRKTMLWYSWLDLAQKKHIDQIDIHLYELEAVKSN